MKNFFKRLAIFFIFLFSFNSLALASDNPFIQLSIDTSSGSLEATTEIMASPIGGMIYFVIGMIIVMFIAGIIAGIIFWGKSNSNR